MNNGVCTERGLLGQFTNSTYVTLGDPYGKKAEMLSRYKKKQFLTMPAKKAVCKDALFGRGFPWLSDGDKYLDKMNYLKTQPKDSRKRGFMSSDASRTDEFVSHIRSEQWRWALGREGAFKKHHEASRGAQTFPAPNVAPIDPLGVRSPNFHTPAHLYDIGKGHCITQFSQKLPRENWYLANRDVSKPRNLGDWVPSSYEIGNDMVAEAELHKPKYANTPIVQSTFYRVGAVKSNAGWTALRPGE